MYVCVHICVCVCMSFSERARKTILTWAGKMCIFDTLHTHVDTFLEKFVSDDMHSDTTITYDILIPYIY